MYKIKKYFKGVLKQGKMVRWPSGKDLMGYFAIVVSVIVFSAVACSIDDFIIAKILGVLDANLSTSVSGAEESVAAAFRMIKAFFAVWF